MKLPLVIGFFLLVSLSYPEDGNSEKYIFPLDIYNGYSSAFQEFRSNHFHAGVDLRTFQKTGFPVYSIAEGQLNTIRMVKNGSGKGLYLKHNDGNTSIYFHLDRFAPWIEKIVRQVQQSTGKKYFGNFSPEIPLSVKKGEVIAYSGETGYGFPHLHLEVRDAHNQAINPFKLLEFPSRDHNHPILRSLILRSKSESLINGNIGESIIRFDKINTSTYQLNLPVVTSGKFDLVLNTQDISDSGKFVAPYKISFFIDDIKPYGLQFDRFSWEDNNQLGFVYDLFYSTPGNFFFNLYFQPDFELEEKKIFFDKVFDQLEIGKHECKIYVKDNFGNISAGLFTFYKVEKPVLELSNIVVEQNRITMDIRKLVAGSADEIIVRLMDKENHELYTGKMDQTIVGQTRELVLDGIGDEVYMLDFSFQKKGFVFGRKKISLGSDFRRIIPDIDFMTYINRDIIFIKLLGDCLTSEDIGLEVIQGGKSQNIKAYDNGDNVFFCFKPVGYEKDIDLTFAGEKNNEFFPPVHKKLRIIHLNYGLEQNFVDGDFEANFYSGAVREPKVLMFEVKNFDSQFPVLTRQISLYPYHFPFLDYVYYAFKKEVPNPRQVGIFNYDFQRKKWKYVNTIHDDLNHTFKTKVISSGTFALMRDIFPPVISLARLGSFTKARIKKIVVKITDRGKGVDDDSLFIWINDKQVIDCEFDPDWHRVLIEDLNYLKPGSNTMKVEISDYAGNKSLKIFQFFLK